MTWGVGFQASVSVAVVAARVEVNFVLVFYTYVAGVANSPSLCALNFRFHSWYRVSLQHPSLLMAATCCSYNCCLWFALRGPCTDCTPQ